MKLNPGEEKGENMDVRATHAQIIREKDEPHERHIRISGFIKHGLYWPLTIWGLWYLVVFSGGFKKDNYVESPFTLPLDKVEAEKLKSL